jgi:hypothetical protein
MKLKEILLASALFLSGAVVAQDLNYNVAGRLEIPFIKRLKVAADLDASPNEISFTFFDNSMKFQKLNDSTYREIVNDEEFYEYSKKDSCYIFKSYHSIAKPRAEKELLEGRVFNKKYESLPDLFEDLINKKTKDTLNFILLGNPYSASLKTTKKGKRTYYTGNPADFIKREEGDKFHFKFPIKFEAEEINGQNIPSVFSTKCLYIPLGLIISIEGRLEK